ncbi:IS110 family transposase [Patescibacteria group bacterium]|nr:IS110 family transposase [Patescibacteria group bacterium]
MTDVFIGMDLHQRTSTLVVKDRDGTVLDKRKIETTPEAVRSYAEEWIGASLAVEPVSQWYFYADLLESLGIDVHIAHPRRVKAIASARIKTDMIDAGVLCDLLRGNLLPEAYHAPKEVRAWKELARFHTSLVRLRVQAKNKVHSILWKNALAAPCDLWTKGGERWLASLALPEPFGRHLAEYRALIGELDGRIKEAARAVEAAVGENEGARLLTTIPGISYLSALTIMAEVGTVERFPSAKQLMGYAGLVPATYSSGGVTRHGKIIKAGSTYLRFVLVEAAHHQSAAKRVKGFGKYYARIKSRKGSSAAAVATARKLCAVVWRVLKDQRPFVSSADFGQPGRPPFVLRRSGR